MQITWKKEKGIIKGKKVSVKSGYLNKKLRFYLYLSEEFIDMFVLLDLKTKTQHFLKPEDCENIAKEIIIKEEEVADEKN